MTAASKSFEQMLQNDSVRILLCDFMWTLRCWLNLKLFEHTSHWKGLSLECKALCVPRYSLLGNFFWQILQENSSLFVVGCADFICVRTWGRWRNFFSQRLHENGFSPVWDIIWISRVWLRLNLLSQMWQPNGFSPVWVLSCALTDSFLSLQYLQNLHLKTFSAWVRSCLSSLSCLL